MIKAIVALLISIAGSAHAGESQCYGTTGNGRLEGGVALPQSGNNFSAYSSLGSLFRRTYVHSQVRDVIVAAYEKLAMSTPAKVYVYGETGWPSGGSFRPHKTHQNGLSVDFMVPVLRDGRSVPLPTSPFNTLGYAIEFDDRGKFESYAIDFDAMALHLNALMEAANEHGIKIWRVIFDPELQPQLFRAGTGRKLKNKVEFSKKRSWVRHDEHYHVDFKIKCRAM